MDEADFTEYLNERLAIGKYRIGIEYVIRKKDISTLSKIKKGNEI